MALSPDELDQIRDVVRTELNQQRYGYWARSAGRSGVMLIFVFLAVLGLHVLVVGGFTIWHLLHPSH
jgi:hypothetical protein